MVIEVGIPITRVGSLFLGPPAAVCSYNGPRVRNVQLEILYWVHRS